MGVGTDGIWGPQPGWAGPHSVGSPRPYEALPDQGWLRCSIRMALKERFAIVGPFRGARFYLDCLHCSIRLAQEEPFAMGVPLKGVGFQPKVELP